MRYDATEAERHFSTISSGLNTFVMNSFAEAQRSLELAVEEINKLKQENGRLMAENEALKVINNTHVEKKE
jgi:hypothetical protein